jgi:hypothetical protein
MSRRTPFGRVMLGDDVRVHGRSCSFASKERRLVRGGVKIHTSLTELESDELSMSE